MDRVHGPTSAQATLRFATDEKKVRVVLYRDHHAWCPYCQKIWLWLEEKKVPYQIEKVTMFCYGEKEAWYKRVCPRGMLPAIKLDGKMITESDDILVALEGAFGPLHASMTDRQVVPLRQLERDLFRAWCHWLCYPSRGQSDEERKKQQFQQVARFATRVQDGGLPLDSFDTRVCGGVVADWWTECLRPASLRSFSHSFRSSIACSLPTSSE
jgi:glutathione S-transferase